ncbi:cytochrome b-c1 complex subunit 2, mitochondrial [Panulirus ornatus]|uniref:cytochrome b-c1 complex subunit 2, mitochondrial n=1 Tax=Panulirus ornatus TaxID=150431 RepID=UPI003A8B039E
MASKVMKPSLLSNLSKRGYAAQAAAAAAQQSVYTLPHQDPKVTTLPSGTVVASLENHAPVSRIAVLFKAGSRYESASNLGASHMLRTCTGLGTKNISHFAITRTIQQIGGSLTALSGREHLLYGLDVIRDNLDEGLKVLGDVASHPAFKPWEMKDNHRRFQTEFALLDSSTVAMELLHRASFRNTGLGNSVFVPDHHIGKLSSDVLSNYVDSTHLASRMAVVGLGVDHDTLISCVNSLGVPAGEGAAGFSSYGGGEIRKETGAAITIVAVAGEGASIGSSDAAALAVAQHILGVGPNIKYGCNAGSVLSQAVAASGGIGMASSININYSDTGLFGYFIIADSASVHKVLDASHKAVMSLKVTEADVARGKNQVKATILMASESGAENLEDMGLQALLTGHYVSPTAAAAAIDAVTPAAVEVALKKVSGSKLSMSIVGDVSKVPYLDQL